MGSEPPGEQSRPGATSPPVRPVGPEDVEPLSACLARAFADDPVSCYLFPTPRSHLRRLERYFRWQFEHVFLRRGEGWTTDDLAGASLWIPPVPRPPSAAEGLLQLATVVPILGRHTGRALQLLDVLERVHPKVEHCYLGTIGTDPERQGRGIGSSLMRVVLVRLDSAGTPAYLESSKEENLPFYARVGFEVIGEVGGPGSGIPRIWLMWREPKPAGDEASPTRSAHPSTG
jgi:ribosomal protein S18 acetylase RimI-like enzyme